MKFFFAISTASFLLSSCGELNLFKEHYDSANQPTSAYIPRQSAQKVRIAETMDLEAALDRYLRNGYVIIGSSIFTGQWESRDFAVKQAKEVGASVVVIFAKRLYDDERQWTLTLNTPQTVNHSGTVNRGMTSWSYTGTSTYYTRETFSGTYVVGHYGQAAVFLAKKR